MALRHHEGPLPEPVAAAARALAEAVRALLVSGVGERAPQAEDPLRRSDSMLFGDPGSARDRDPAVRHLHHLGATLTGLAARTSAGG